MFIDKMRQVGLGAFNTRPSLFVGNLGTTHHAFDTDEISTMMSRKWRDKLKSDNFVSAVLHGTTNTHPHILSEATVGCHKINIAGDFLHTLINGLPSGLIKVVEGGGVEPKKMIPKIRKQMDSMSAAEVNRLKDSIKAHCMSILDNINSPKLSSLDMSYFRYKNFKFTDLQVETICDELNKNVLEYEVSEQGLSDNRLGYEFSASMIEVPFGDEYKKLTEMLWNEGIRHFHIDVGDGKFIDRTFSGLDKAKYLKEKYPESILHCHLMVENPQFSNNESLSPIEQYINAGCEAIAIHRNSFTKQKYLLSGLELIKNCGARPGLIIEITETFDGKLQDLIVEYDLDWVVIMGVAVGYGGQIFNMSSLNTVTSFTQYAKKTDKPFLIEIDGGLTMENIQICKHKGAQILSGWSLIKGNTIEETRDKVRTVRKLLS